MRQHPGRDLALARNEERASSPDFREDFILSPSQLSKAESCKRKWWLSKVKRLPQLRKVPDPRTFGDILHEVLERYYSMDELGRGPSGRPVNLYPDGKPTCRASSCKCFCHVTSKPQDHCCGRTLPWYRTVSKFGEDKGQERQIGTADQALIRALIAKAREDGKIHRPPESRCELPFTRELKDDEGNSYSPRMWIVGYIDMAHEAGVEDHKSTKAKKWLLSKNKLLKDYQMNCYGNELLFIYEDKGLQPPDSVLLCHNGFVKDVENPLVKKTEVPASAERLRSFWSARVLPLAEDLHDLKFNKKPQDWRGAPGAEPGSKACEAYGGCPYLTICSGREEPDAYKQRIQQQNSNPSGCPTLNVVASSTQPHSGTGENNMNFAARLGALAGRPGTGTARPTPPAPTPPAARPRPTATPAQAAAPKPRAVAGAPPWHTPGCVPCTSHPGFNSKGSPCRICNIKSKQAHRPTSDGFTIEAIEGMVVWTNGTDEGEMSLVGTVETKANTAPPSVAAPSPQETEPPPLHLDGPSAEEEEAPAPEPVPPATPKKRRRGRPPGSKNKPKADTSPKQATSTSLEPQCAPQKTAGCTLLIDCVSVTPQQTVSLSQMIAELGKEAAKANNVASYYQLDFYKRREAMNQAFEQLDLGNMTITASTASIEEREALNILRARADYVIQGIR